MHPFAETAPEITTATVKQVAEIVKTFKKRVDGQEFSAAAYSILASKDAAYLLIYLEQEFVRKLPKQCIFTTPSGHSRFHLRFPRMYVRICSKFQPQHTQLTFHTCCVKWWCARVASRMARRLNHDAHPQKKRRTKFKRTVVHSKLRK
jgi:hypothetical protein